jgi:hypothetical protein
MRKAALGREIQSTYANEIDRNTDGSCGMFSLT